MTRPAQAVRVEQRVTCPACRAGLGVGSRDASAVYGFARVYLGGDESCSHREVWDQMDKREHVRERSRGKGFTCPWAYAVTDRCERCST